jgi:hypothetical protein
MKTTRDRLQDAPYLRCRHLDAAASVDLTLRKGVLQQRIYHFNTPGVEVISNRLGDDVTGNIQLPEPGQGDWAVCLASEKRGRGNIRTWPEWTWGRTREAVPVWFRGVNFDGRANAGRGKRECTPKGNYLAASADVESFIERMQTSLPTQVVVREESRSDRGFMIVRFEYEGSELEPTTHPKGWIFPLRAACRRLNVPMKNTLPR